MGKRAKLICSLDFVLGPEHMEHPKGKSMTLPDEAYTIRELLEKFSRNQRMDELERAGTYDSAPSFDSEDLSKVRDMDPFDREELANTIRDRNNVVKDLFSKKRKDKERERDLARARERDAKDGDSDEGGTKAAKLPSKDRAKEKDQGKEPRRERSEQRRDAPGDDD